MAHYGRKHQYIILDDIEHMKDDMRRDVFDGSEEGTFIVTTSISGYFDPFTEEFTPGEDNTYHPVSGIVDRVHEKDQLLGANGRIKVGDVKVIYPYDAISGVVIQNELNQIQLETVNVSGLYNVQGHIVDVLADTPVFLEVALTLDSNG